MQRSHWAPRLGEAGPRRRRPCSGDSARRAGTGLFRARRIGDAGRVSGAGTAAGIAAAVRAGAPPVDAVRAALDRIAVLDGDLGAFATVRREPALTEASLLAGRWDLERLPLAGVPVAVKDTVPVRGVAPWREPSAPAEADHPLVLRLRIAGAV